MEMANNVIEELERGGQVFGLRVASIGPGWSLVQVAPAGPESGGVAIYAAAEAACRAAVAGLLQGEEETVLVNSGSSITYGRRPIGEMKVHATLADEPGIVLGRLQRGGAAAFGVAVVVRDAANAEVATMEMEWRATRPLSVASSERLVA